MIAFPKQLSIPKSIRGDYRRNLRNSYRAKGRCECGSWPEPGGKMCYTCLEYRRKARRKKKQSQST